jgi:hypothetical protein
MAKKSPFPTDDTVSDAADRGEAVLALYRKHGFADESWDELLTLAIQDVALHGYVESGVASQEPDGDGCSISPELLCGDAGARARDLISDEQDTYDEELDCGSVTLAGEQARALVLAAADSLRLGGLDEATKARLIAAVEAINGAFHLGIENA